MPFCPLYMNPAILKSACFLWRFIYIHTFLIHCPEWKKLNLELCGRLDQGTSK